jgi:glycosyltransferase involved in cell wall biosynthesis
MRGSTSASDNQCPESIAELSGMFFTGRRSQGLKILFLTSGPNAPASRYRVFQFLPHLRQLGFRCSVANSFPEKYDYFPLIGWRLSRLLKRLVRRWHLLQMTWTQPDVVVLEREIFDEPDLEFERKLRRLAPTLILDIDDGIFLRYPGKFEKLAELCDFVICGNSYIRDHLQPSNSRISIIPTTVDAGLYHVKNPVRDAGDRVIVGWIGTPSNVPQISLVLPALRELSKSVSLELRIVTAETAAVSDLSLQGLPFRLIPWDESTAIHEIAQFDIGIMPLEKNDPWNLYKCGLKLIEYMAVGIPAVASPVGVNSEIVQDGHDGLLADTSEQWLHCLRLLADDVNLRNRIGKAARETVERRYSVQAVLPDLVRVLETAHSPRK